ncbi:PAS domain S-box protein [Maridesulfovibrio sp.]|uniref:PAS domain S-box protein n=1 Tax=Maridesulfovibrio sp. TaxID=2795000 RepID=UPI002A1873E0|nr:PAS domain S-box protein [Maridesulfovibrio sp.]
MKDRTERSYGLTAQLLIPMLTLVMVMGIFIFSWSFYLSKSSLETELGIDAEKTKSLVELTLDDILEDIQDDLVQMSANREFKTAVKEGNRDSVDRILYDFMSSRQGYLMDVLTVLTKDRKKWVEAGIIELPVLQIQNRTGRTDLTDASWECLSFQTMNNIRTMIICTVPIYDEAGNICGTLYGGMDLNSNVSFIDRLKKVSAAINAALISRHRLIISTSSPSSQEMKRLVKWSEQAGTGQVLMQDDLMFSAIQLLPDKSDSPLLFTFSRHNPAFESLKKHYMQNLLILLTLATVLAVLTAWGMQKHILAALRKLTDYAVSVAEGKRDMGFEEGKVREFNQLGSALETMVNRLDENSTYISKLFSSAKAPIITCDLHGKILDMNPAAEEVAGTTRELSPNLTISEIFPQEFADRLNSGLKDTIEGGATPVVEIPIQADNEKYNFFIWTFSPVQLEENKKPSFILLQGQNVTASRLAMQKARESEARLRQIIDLLPQDIYANDLDGKFLLVNRKKANRLGFDAKDITGKNLADILRNPVEAARTLEDDRIVIKRNEKLLTEESYIDKSRNTHWVETTRVPYISTESNTPAILTISMDITRVKEAEQELQSLNKELVERVAMRTTELENANSALLKSMDELRQTQDKLVETEKMASLGELVAGVAHEINTPLGISVTSASFLQEMIFGLRTRFNNGSMKRSDLEKCLNTGGEAIGNIVKNLERSAKLISNFKQLAVDQTSDDIRQINLNEYLKGITLSLKSKTKEHNHTLEVECPNGLEIRISPGSLMQVLTNLVNNSITHAFPDRENGHIKVEAKRNGNGILLTYSDDGIGMDNEQVMRVFDPFYTTARSSGSAGLGMHLVYNLVTRALKGRIECKSSPGEGTVYEIWFPINRTE